MLRFHRSIRLWLLSTRRSLFALCGCCTPECTDTFSFSFSYAHGRFALTGRFLVSHESVTLASRDLGFPRVTCHRFAYLYVSLFSHVTLTLYARVMAICLDSPYVTMTSSFVMMTSSLIMLISLSPAIDSYLSRPCRFPLRPMLPGLLISPVLVTPSPLPDFLSLPDVLPLTDWTLFLSLTFTDSTPVCTCIVRTHIYTGLEMGRSPSSIYFATTLVL